MLRSTTKEHIASLFLDSMGVAEACGFTIRGRCGV